jgi:hypothetical protein
MKVKITPKHWERFQHYKDRSPSWIKLHRQLLDDYEFHCLPVASRALAPLLWLLASEYRDGQIVGSVKQIAFRLHMAEPDFVAALDPLIQAGFFSIENDVDECKQAASTLLAPCLHDASAPLAERKQDASPEKERETETEKKYSDVTANAVTSAERPAAPPPAKARGDPRQELFDRGRQTLQRLTGRTEASCRSLIGRWLRDTDDEAVHVLAAIEEADRSGPLADPTAWISARLKPRRHGNGTARSISAAAGELAAAADRGEFGFGPRPRLVHPPPGEDDVRLLPTQRKL